MRECICGKPIPRRKERGHREREYCSDKCRKRAWRERNKVKHNVDRVMRDYNERLYNSMYQSIHRETWQDELESAEERISSLSKEVSYLIGENKDLREYIELLQDLRASDAEEIARLTTILDEQSKKRRR